MPTRTLLCFALAVLALLPACTSDSADTPAETYEVRGLYEGTRFEGAAVSVVHETIPGVMDAMRMSLVLDDPAEVDELAVGTKVRFTVTVGDRLVASDFEALPDTTTLDLPDELQPAAANADTTDADTTGA
ncbi:MAG: copper-binding protein [Bacteroidota bacterium]